MDVPVRPAAMQETGVMQTASDQFLILGTDQEDIFSSRDGDGVIFAGAGVDHIWTGDGAQFLDGGDGNDALLLGTGDQTVMGGAGNDYISGNAGAQLLMGGDGNDAIWAGTGTQTVQGGSGNDHVEGNNGPQLLMGDDGDDLIGCGSGSQTVSGGAGADTIATDGRLSDRSPSRHLVFGDEGNDRILACCAADTVFGGTGDDTISGATAPSDAPAQFLDGGAGNDWFYAGGANATLTGGAGRDTFTFCADAARRTAIADFRAGQDIIQLQSAPTRPPTHVLPPVPTVSAAPGLDGDAVLHLGHGATVTLLGVPAQQVAMHLPAYVRVL